MSVLGVVAFERPEQNECWLVANEAKLMSWSHFMVRPDKGRSSEPLRRLFKHSIVRVQQMKSWCSSGALDLHAVSTRKKAAFVEHIV